MDEKRMGPTGIGPRISNNEIKPISQNRILSSTSSPPKKPNPIGYSSPSKGNFFKKNKNNLLIGSVALLAILFATLGIMFIIDNNKEPDPIEPPEGQSIEIILAESKCVEVNGKNIIKIYAKNNLDKIISLRGFSSLKIDGIEILEFLIPSVGPTSKEKIADYDCSLSQEGFCIVGNHFIEFEFEGYRQEGIITCDPLGEIGNETFCGDGICQENENELNCPLDCFEDEPETIDNFPLVEYLSSSYYNVGLATSISTDGNYLYRSGGSILQKIDLIQLRSSNPPDIENMVIAEAEVYSSPLDIIEIKNKVYICGGDFGIHKTNKELSSTPSLMDIHERDLWCTSLDSTRIEGKDLLLAVWSGLGDTELKIYDTQDDSILATIPLNEQTGLENEGTGWDVEEYLEYAYIAMGTSGVARVDLRDAIAQGSTNPLQGPLVVTNENENREIQKLQSVRDLSVMEGYLYAAAGGQGLIQIDLNQIWSDSMQTTTYFHENFLVNQYPLKVETMLDNSVSTTVLMVRTGSVPNHAEWGPYSRLGGWEWDSSSPQADINELDNQNHNFEEGNDNNANGIVVFERRLGTSNLIKFAEKFGVPESIETLSIQQVGTDYFAYGNIPQIYNFFRDTDNRIKLGWATDGREFIQGRGGYTDGRQSLIEPGIIIAGSDAGFHHFQILQGNPLKFTPLENTLDAEHNLGLWNEVTWITPEGKEFLIMGGAGESWPIREITWSNGFPSVVSWLIPVNLGQSTDSYGYDPRSYAHAGVDEETGLIALSRSTSKEGLILMDKDAIYNTAKNTPEGSDVIPPTIMELVLHEEAPPASQIGEELVYSFHPKFFRDKNQKRMLAVPAGHYVDINSGDFRHPKVVFFNIPESLEETEIKSITVVEPRSPSMALDIEIFDFDEKQMAVVVGSTGDIYLHDIDKLSEVLEGEENEEELEAVDTWIMRDQVLDKRKTLISDVRIRKEEVDGEEVTRIYVAANHDGVYVLEVKKTGNGYFLEEIKRLNTIFQSVGISIEDIDGEDILLSYGHGGGIAAFGEG